MLSAVEGTERLRVFRADMAEEGSFDDAITGCAALFHVAASMDLHLAPDQHDVALRPGVGAERGWGGISLPGTSGRDSPKNGDGAQTAGGSRVGHDGGMSSWSGQLVDESAAEERRRQWISVEGVGRWFWDGGSWVYILSKRLAEEAAFGFARENGIRLVSVVLPTVAGPFLTPAVPTSVQLLLSPVTLSPTLAAGDPKLHALLASVHARFGCVPLAHVFHMDAPAAHGRYLCAGGSHQMAHRSNPQKGN
ncbi:hypothetical protein ACQ4PT_014192 [Festuca glaucescens]